jgi:hypothetical protein
LLPFYFLFFSFFFSAFLPSSSFPFNRPLLYIPGWPQTHYLPVSVSQVLRLHTFTTMPGFVYFESKCYIQYALQIFISVCGFSFYYVSNIFCGVEVFSLGKIQLTSLILS